MVAYRNQGRSKQMDRQKGESKILSPHVFTLKFCQICKSRRENNEKESCTRAEVPPLVSGRAGICYHVCMSPNPYSWHHSALPSPNSSNSPAVSWSAGLTWMHRALLPLLGLHLEVPKHQFIQGFFNFHQRIGWRQQVRVGSHLQRKVNPN